MILVDTNVLVDLLEDEPEWVDWSTERMRELSLNHELVINPIIYAELSLTFTVVEDLDDAIAELELRVAEIPRPALFLAGKAYIEYRKRGGIKNNVLPDFLIGAQAAILGVSILTRDVRRFRTYFPSVNLITP